MTTKTATC